MRRDRLRAPVWVASIVALVAVSAASIAGLYDTEAELQEYAELFQADPALKAIGGPGYGLAEPTLGAVVMNEILIYSFIVVSLMCSFLVVRHTRAEEESDRAELVRSAAVGRLASLAAAGAWVMILDVLVAAGLAATLLAFDLELTGTLAFTAAVGALGLVFIGVAAVAAQVAASARAATAGAGVALGVFFMLRAVGDLGTGWVTWLSPLGWAQSMRAFDDERWWVLVPLIVAAIALMAGSVVLSARRDLGAGYFQQRPGPAEASERLATPLALAFRLQRASLISWTVALAVLGFFYGIVADQAEQILESEAIAEFFAQAGVGTPTELFLATMILTLALIASGYTVSTVLRLRTEELAVRAEPVLATAVGRARWLLSYLIVAAGGTIVVMTVSGLAVGLGLVAQLGDGEMILPILGASFAMVPAQLVLAAFTAALVGWRPSLAQVAWGGVAIAVIVGLLGETLKLPSWTRNVSPFHHVPVLPAADLEVLPLLGLLAVAAALTGVGMGRYHQARHRMTHRAFRRRGTFAPMAQPVIRATFLVTAPFPRSDQCQTISSPAIRRP